MPLTKEKAESQKAATKETIDRTALALFARKGLAVTVSEIARAAGLSQGLLYSYYPSKDALITELARQATSSSGRYVSEIAQGGGDAADCIDKISRMMCYMFTSVPKGIEYFMFMTQVGMSDFKLPEETRYTPGTPHPFETTVALIVRGQKEGTVAAGDPARLSMTYWAAIQGLCCYRITGMDVMPEPEILNRILLV